MRRRFAITIFLSAFLLFQVQPMMGRFILPWFGGTPAVWSNCLLFFQFALLAGYAYAHLLGSVKNPRIQAATHTGLLLASLLLIPVIPDPGIWKPASSDNPSGKILLLLSATIGGPYFLLSSTAPLLQRWYSLTHPARAPWRLYALSNFGSFLALFSYPILFEPFLRLGDQSRIWAGLYVIFAAGCIWTAWRLRPYEGPDRVLSEEEDAAAQPGTPLTPWTILFWLALSATGSTLLVSTTNLITQDVAVAPFLWILPLSLYLLSFILTFESDRWYRRLPFAVMVGILCPVAAAVTGAGVLMPLWGEGGVYLAALFVTCMLCHGELQMARPSPSHLTAFYLTISAGGVAGGIFVALIAPTVFNQYTEYPLGLTAACVLGIIGWMRSGAFAHWTSRNFGIRIPMMAMLFGAIGAVALLLIPPSNPPRYTVRNFFGVLRVTDLTDGQGRAYRQLTHGRIQHGSQYLEGELHTQPVSYYGSHSGVALVMNAMKPEPRRIAVIGLGTGSMAAWGRAGDSIRFYEINPIVEDIAHEWFSYLDDSPARIDIALGDARVQMERELAEGQHNDYDLVVVDAFTSDAIPTHLLTAECAEIYRQRLAPGGMLLMHISNRSMDLDGVVRAMADHMGWRASQLLSSGYEPDKENASRWVLVSSNRDFVDDTGIEALVSGWSDAPEILWTDDFTSLWHVIRW